MKSNLRRTGTLVAMTALTFTLASCSSGQSVAEACEVAEQAVLEVSQESRALTQEALAGEGDLESAMAPVQDALAKAVTQVSNEEVGDALKELKTVFDGFVGDLAKFDLSAYQDLDYSDPASLEKLDEMQAQLEEFSTTMEAHSSSLTAANTKLEELCNA